MYIFFSRDHVAARGGCFLTKYRIAIPQKHMFILSSEKLIQRQINSNSGNHMVILKKNRSSITKKTK